jgi:hypothetical protein
MTERNGRELAVLMMESSKQISCILSETIKKTKRYAVILSEAQNRVVKRRDFSLRSE